MAITKINKITNSQITENSVKSLANRPNEVTTFGVGGLNASNLKERFDKLSELAISKINELITAFEGVDSLKYLAFDSTQSLYDVIFSGNLANSIKILLNGSSTLSSLQSVLDTFAQTLALKGNSSEHYTKNEANSLYRKIADSYTKSEIDVALSGKSSANEVYTSGQIVQLIYTKSEVDSLLSAITNLVNGKAKTYVIATLNALSEISNQSLGDVALIIDTEVPDYWWDGTSWQKLEVTKVDLSVFYDKTEIDAELQDISNNFLAVNQDISDLQAVAISQESTENSEITLQNYAVTQVVGAKTTFAISTPSMLSSGFQSVVRFSCGTSISFQFTNSTDDITVKWSGSDVNSSGVFLPIANKSYELNFAMIGNTLCVVVGRW